MPRRARKQVHELTASDFEAQPCWEYAADEEADEAQDECTVRPLALPQLANAGQQVFVQAVFFFPNGRVRLGMVTLNAGEDPSGHQPALFLPNGSLSFYNGASEPKPSEVKRFLAGLRKVSPTPLPIHYASALCSEDGVPLATGTLTGLYWLANWKTGELSVVA